jgi:cellobiose phosphorylase
VLQADLELAPGESRDVLVMLGIGLADTVGQETAAAFGSVDRAGQELERLKESWHAKLHSLEVETPDENFNHMLNTWAPYNALVTFNWSRAASLVYNGERNGLGFRDSVQDVLGILAADPQAARDRLELMLTGQVSSGGAMPVIKPFDHHPGREKPPAEARFRSDDCLWFFNAVPAYVAESGDVDFYQRVLPYADEGEATVFGHLRRALEFNLERSGAHGLPCGLEADWNDCLKLGYHGESLFVAFQLYFGLTVYAQIADGLGLTDESGWALAQRETLSASIQQHCWDGGWWIWAIGEDGTVYGTKEASEGQVYLNTQVWSVISGAAQPEQARKAMQAVHDQLATPYGLKLSAPPFVKTKVDVMRAVLFNPGIKENAGIFNHTQGWGVMAACLLGNGDRAFDYYRAFMPASYNDCAEVRQVEPYVQAQTTYSTVSPRGGNARTAWLSGAVPWALYSAAHAILGIQPEIDGLRIDPCIPSAWPGFKAVRRFRGKRVAIRVENPNGVCRGVARLVVNGETLEGALIPMSKLKEENEVVVTLG